MGQPDGSWREFLRVALRVDLQSQSIVRNGVSRDCQSSGKVKRVTNIKGVWEEELKKNLCYRIKIKGFDV